MALGATSCITGSELELPGMQDHWFTATPRSTYENFRPGSVPVIVLQIIQTLAHSLSEPSQSPTANMSVPQQMSHTTANWHWKNKNIGPWAKQWFQRELTAITITGDDDESVQVTGVTEVDGDVELGQRKSKYVIASLPLLSSKNVVRLAGMRLIAIFTPRPPG